MNKDLYEIISEKYNLKYNDYDYWKKYEYDDEEKMYDNTEVANSLDDYDCKKNDYSEILKEIVEKYKKSLTDEEVLERMNIKVIESFLRKKKLEMLKKGSDDI
jgi:hypothetical protein